MRKRISVAIGGIVVIAIITEILSSQSSPRVLQMFSDIFAGSVKAALNPAPKKTSGNKNTAFGTGSTGSDYFASDVPVAWIMGPAAGPATTSGLGGAMPGMGTPGTGGTPSPKSGPSTPSPNPAPSSPRTQRSSLTPQQLYDLQGNRVFSNGNHIRTD